MLYAVQMCEHEQDCRAEMYLVGIFSDYSKACDALHKVFLKQCDVYCVDENLADETQCDTDCSFYNQGKGKFSIDYKRNGEVAGEVFANIIETEIGTINLDCVIE
jgi:hypothetical protein